MLKIKNKNTVCYQENSIESNTQTRGHTTHTHNSLHRIYCYTNIDCFRLLHRPLLKIKKKNLILMLQYKEKF